MWFKATSAIESRAAVSRGAAIGARRRFADFEPFGAALLYPPLPLKIPDFTKKTAVPAVMTSASPTLLRPAVTEVTEGTVAGSLTRPARRDHDRASVAARFDNAPCAKGQTDSNLTAQLAKPTRHRSRVITCGFIFSI